MPLPPGTRVFFYGAGAGPELTSLGPMEPEAQNYSSGSGSSCKVTGRGAGAGADILRRGAGAEKLLKAELEPKI